MKKFVTIINILLILEQTPESMELCPSGLTQYDDYCYRKVEDTTFPFECPYKRTYAHEFDSTIASQFADNSWVNVKRDLLYGYFANPPLHYLYGLLMSGLNSFPNNNFEDCLLRPQVANPFSYEITPCNNRYVGFCVYHNNDTLYCEAYNKICNTSRTCHCKSEAVTYLCETTACTDFDEEDCSRCDEKFEQYPYPEIEIRFDQINSIIVAVKNPLKLVPIEGIPLYCFTDVYSPDGITVRKRYYANEIIALQESRKISTYRFEIENLAEGVYWCEGFTFPGVEKVESNEIIAGLRSAYGLNFVLNFTIEQFTLIPYSVHRDTIFSLRSIIENNNYQLIRVPDLSPLRNNRSTVDVTVHMTTFPQITDIEIEFQEVSRQIKLCESVGLHDCNLAYGDLCLSDVTVVDSEVNATWSTTFLGQQASPNEVLLQSNGLPIMRRCLGSFMRGAYWSDVSGEVFRSAGSEVTQDLYDILKSNGTAQELNQALWDIISEAENVISYDVHLIAQIFQRIAQSSQDFDLKVLTKSLDSIIEIDLDVLELAQIELNATDVILYNFDLALGTVGGNTTTTITTTHVIAQVWNLEIHSGIRGVAIYQIDGDFVIKNLTNVTTLDDIEANNLKLAIVIPPELQQEIFEQNKDSDLVAAVYLNVSGVNRDVNAENFVVSIFATGFLGSNLNEGLPIIFDANSEIGGNVYCGFWDFGINDMLVAINGRWQKEQIPDFHDKLKTCVFSHMTHFALLANAPSSEVLNLISLIGCGLSIFGITSIIVTAVVFKAWRNCISTKILLSFSLTILMQMMLLFLTYVRNMIWCTITAVGLHYVVVSQFCWMLVIGYLQYRKFVQVLLSEPTHLLLFSHVTGWLLPVFPIAITFVLQSNNYVHRDYCYLSGLGLYFGLFVPVACVIMANVTIFVLIFASLSCNKAQAFGDKQILIMLKVKLSVVLFFLLGFSWLFGLLAHFLKSIVLSYLFCLTSTTQGFALYVYFILLNKNTRQFWAKKFIRCKRIVATPSSKERVSKLTE